MDHKKNIKKPGMRKGPGEGENESKLKKDQREKFIPGTNGLISTA